MKHHDLQTYGEMEVEYSSRHFSLGIRRKCVVTTRPIGSVDGWAPEQVCILLRRETLCPDENRILVFQSIA